MEKLAEYKNFGYSVTLYPNQLVIYQSLLPGVKMGTEKIILLKDIAGLDAQPGRPPILRRVNGETVEITLHPWQVKDLRARLMELWG
jgi:hypothetical protein